MITVVVTASPIPSHPDASIIDETLDSIRHHLPTAPIMVLFDGVRDEQATLEPAYREHIKSVLDRWPDVSAFIHSIHMHQVGMLRDVIGNIDTPLMLFCEHDTPLLTDRVIDWPLITEWLLSGKSNCIRLYHEEKVPDPHRYLMFGMEREGPFLRTSQYSARPHIATVDKYREWLKEFSPDAKCFLEDKLHSVVQEDVKLNSWWHQRVHIYAPDTDQGFRRSGHLDGRASGDKFDNGQVF